MINKPGVCNEHLPRLRAQNQAMCWAEDIWPFQHLRSSRDFFLRSCEEKSPCMAPDHIPEPGRSS